jgi:hypothetical protein
MYPRIHLACVLALLLASTVSSAQVQVVPAPAPTASAASRDWFRDRSPIFFAGELYYPAGARTHFNGDVMVRTGRYDGIPLYADTSIEPFSQILVPAGGGLLQPYERRRAGTLAGTSGSRVSELPRELGPWDDDTRGRAPVVDDLQARQSRDRWAVEPERRYPDPDEEAGRRTPFQPGHVQTIREPEDNRGIWISYEGARWTIAGPAVPFDARRFRQIGTYYGFPVYAAQGVSELFIPAWPGMLAIYGKEN